MSGKRDWKKPLIFLLIFILPPLFYLLLSTGKHNLKEDLPYYGPKEPVERVVEGKKVIDTLYHEIKDFAFVNQYGDTITKDSVKGKILVVDYIFTTCQSICPKMSTQMGMLNHKIKDFDDVIILSHTVDPEHDTPEVLLEYAKGYGAKRGKWYFLTGNKKDLYRIARESYFITAMEGDGGPEDFIHSEKFVLIDKNGHIRGFYDGTNPQEVDKLKDDIKLLRSQEFVKAQRQRK
ncbi:MAG: SCO family protein [Bacteroidetes bacterium]|nr:MAG: SCO family protein [Bacteroidota bacterium]